MENTLLEVNNLKKHFPITKGFFQKVTGQVKAVEGISFNIKSGQTLGLVGESGCGKTTTGNLIMNLIKPTNGQIFFENKDILLMNKKEQKNIYRDLQMIFQDPFGSLHPRMTVEKLVSEPLFIHKILSKEKIKERVLELIELVGLKSEHIKRCIS